MTDVLARSPVRCRMIDPRELRFRSALGPGTFGTSVSVGAIGAMSDEENRVIHCRVSRISDDERRTAARIRALVEAP